MNVKVCSSMIRDDTYADGLELSRYRHPLSLLSYGYTHTHLASSLRWGVVLSIRPWLFLCEQYGMEGGGKR